MKYITKRGSDKGTALMTVLVVAVVLALAAMFFLPRYMDKNGERINDKDTRIANMLIGGIEPEDIKKFEGDYYENNQEKIDKLVEDMRAEEGAVIREVIQNQEEADNQDSGNQEGAGDAASGEAPAE